MEAEAEAKGMIGTMSSRQPIRKEKFTGTMTKSKDDRSTVFDSEDFKNFLNAKLMVSKDSANGFPVFKSKDSFVSGFLSKEWETKSPRSKPSSLFVDGDQTPLINTNADLAVMKSQDWLLHETLGTHVEIPYSIGMFSSCKKTPTTISKEQTDVLASSMSYPTIRTDFSSPLMISVAVENSTFKLKVSKKKRIRKPQKKIIPMHKKYVELSDKDVLQGRGGRSNHHPGNVRYREEVERVQEWYKKTNDKDEKTRISKTLLLYVQSFGGNFLEKDESGWYIIDDVVARRKVSQALREDKDPEKRKAKRYRFIAKRERLEAERRKEV